MVKNEKMRIDDKLKYVNPEVYFLKYAFPCSHILKFRGEVSNEDILKLKDAALNNRKLERAYLEKIYFRAFARMDKIARELKKDRWDLEVIKEYFRVRHNDVVACSDNDDSFKDLCKVHKATVKEKRKESILVEYGERKRVVKKDFVPNVEVGDVVTIHYDYAIEKI